MRNDTEIGFRCVDGLIVVEVIQFSCPMGAPEPAGGMISSSGSFMPELHASCLGELFLCGPAVLRRCVVWLRGYSNLPGVTVLTCC